MGEFERIGEGWVFWRRYGHELHAVDASLVAPVLNSLGASTVGPKWLWDSNSCRWMVDGKDVEITLDLPDDTSRVVEVEVAVLCSESFDKTAVGKVAVQLPCENWAAPQEQLRALLSGQQAVS